MSSEPTAPYIRIRVQSLKARQDTTNSPAQKPPRHRPRHTANIPPLKKTSSHNTAPTPTPRPRQRVNGRAPQQLAPQPRPALHHATACPGRRRQNSRAQVCVWLGRLFCRLSCQERDRDKTERQRQRERERGGVDSVPDARDNERGALRQARGGCPVPAPDASASAAGADAAAGRNRNTNDVVLVAPATATHQLRGNVTRTCGWRATRVSVRAPS